MRREKTEDRRQVFYEVTDKALDLVPVLLEISRWSARYDANTAAPPEMIRLHDADRERLIAEVVKAARARQA